MYIDKSNVLKHSPIGKTCPYVLARASIHDKDNFHIYAYCYNTKLAFNRTKNYLYDVSEKDFDKLCNIHGHLKQGKICEEKRHVRVHKPTYGR